jgi:hypothetical protein
MLDLVLLLELVLLMASLLCLSLSKEEIREEKNKGYHGTYRTQDNISIFSFALTRCQFDSRQRD